MCKDRIPFENDLLFVWLTSRVLWVWWQK